MEASTLRAIDNLISDYQFVQNKLTIDEPSIAQNILQNLKKMLILSCASYYETEIMTAISTFSEKKSETLQDAPHGYDALENLSFFKLFDFGRTNPNTTAAFLKPLKALGKRFSAKLCEEVKNEPEKETQVNAFQEICRLRNLLAHNDLIAYHDDALNNKTCDDIRALHQKALNFVDLMKQKLT